MPCARATGHPDDYSLAFILPRARPSRSVHRPGAAILPPVVRVPALGWLNHHLAQKGVQSELRAVTTIPRRARRWVARKTGMGGVQDAGRCLRVGSAVQALTRKSERKEPTDHHHFVPGCAVVLRWGTNWARIAANGRRLTQQLCCCRCISRRGGKEMIDSRTASRKNLVFSL